MITHVKCTWAQKQDLVDNNDPQLKAEFSTLNLTWGHWETSYILLTKQINYLILLLIIYPHTWAFW